MCHIAEISYFCAIAIDLKSISSKLTLIAVAIDHSHGIDKD